MVKPVTIRLATSDDIPQLFQLYDELVITTTGVESSKEPSLEDYQKTLAEISLVPGYEVLVAVDQGEVVGSIVLLIMPNLTHHASPWALVENMIIDSKKRGQQLGRQLIEYAIRRAKEAGCYTIILNSNKKRRSAHKFYRSLGFEAVSHGFSIYF